MSCGRRYGDNLPRFTLLPAEKIVFNLFVDCNMAEAWIGDRLRILPGKYGENPLWADVEGLKFADNRNAKVFASPYEAFEFPHLFKNLPTDESGLHGDERFETVCQDPRNPSGRRLYVL